MHIIAHPEMVKIIIDEIKLLPSGISGMGGAGIKFAPSPIMTEPKLIKRSWWERLGGQWWWRFFTTSLRYNNDFTWSDWWEVYWPQKIFNVIEVPSKEFIVMKEPNYLETFLSQIEITVDKFADKDFMVSFEPNIDIIRRAHLDIKS